MSLSLHRLGVWLFDHARQALAVQLLVLFTLAGLTIGFGGRTAEVYTIPGSQAQTALDSLANRFPEVSKTSATVLVQAPTGQRIDAEAGKQAVAQVVSQLKGTDHVTAVTDPFAAGVSGAVSKDGSTALVNAQLDQQASEVSAPTLDALRAVGTTARDDGYTVAAGGSAFGQNAPEMGITELGGVAISLLVMLLLLRSIRAASIPLLSAIAGVAATGLLITLACAVTSVSSSALLLAVMIGTAVGIDYALFIVTRFRAVLREGASTRDATGLALATAGSAVVFAALTVFVALAAMVVVGLPFLSVLGLCGAVAVAMAVIGALTVVPVLLGLFGDRLRSAAPVTSDNDAATAPSVGRRRFQFRIPDFWGGWLRTVTRIPWLTITLVVLVLGALAWPARNLSLALPNAGDAPTSTSQRYVYDQVSEKFGPGHNGPLLVSVDLIATTDPAGVMKSLATDLGRVPGVQQVELSTPNQTGETGVVVLAPTTGPKDAATEELVQRLRADQSTLEKQYNVKLAVTGSTAAQIDISTTLSRALLPFGLLVVGLCLVLLLIVFRSLVIPLTAALGYLLSLTAAFGVVALVFHGPVVSFLPIIVMGVLFGLAMDYQVFLVSRMHEHFAHTGNHRESVVTGFRESAPVVAAAATIMTVVFAAFIPGGSPVTKPMAVGLSAGVALDAFVVRMVLVPALLTAIGPRSWAIPTWLATRLPHLDIEGQGTAKVLAARDRLATSPDALQANNVSIDDAVLAVSWALPKGSLGVIVGPEGSGKTALLLALSGRLPTDHGELSVAGMLLPEQAHQIRHRVALAELRGINDLDPSLTLDQHVAERYAATRLHAWSSQQQLQEAADLYRQLLNVAHADPHDLVHRESRVSELNLLQRKLFGVALACLDEPALVMVDDVSDLPTRDQRLRLFDALTEVTTLAFAPAVVAATNDPDDLPRGVRQLRLPAPFMNDALTEVNH